MTKFAIFIILSLYIVAIPLAQSNDNFNQKEYVTNKTISSTANSNTLDLDNYVVDILDLNVQISWQNELLSYFNDSLYMITDFSSEQTTLAQISPVSGSVEAYIVIPEGIKSIHFSGNSLFTANYENKKLTEYYDFPNTEKSRSYDLQGRRIGPVIATETDIWYLSEEWVFNANWYWIWELRSLDYDGFTVSSSPNRYDIPDVYNSIAFDGLRLSFLSDFAIEIFDMRVNSLRTSFFLPGVNDEGTESNYYFSGLTFDGRYYWTIAKNSQQLFKIDVLALLDYEGDGLTDGNELDIGTSLTSFDTDSDGMSDLFEVTYDLDPLNYMDNSSDLDSDGLTNLEEFNLNSNPTSTDTDGDLLDDFTEVQIGTDINNKDSDGDGLIDSEDPRPLKKPQWWEIIGSYWSVVIGLFFLFIYSLAVNHRKNS